MAELSALTGQTDDSGLVLALDRDDEVVEVRTTPAVLPSGQTGIGVQLVETGLVSYPFYLAPLQGLFVTASYTYEITSVFLQIIGDLVTAGRPSVDVSGPIGIAVITGEVAKFGFLYLLQFTALLSINLGVLNVLPLPALDGGRLLFLLIEKLRGRSVGVRFEGIVHNIGFLLLMIMVVVITYGDVLRFGDQILQSFSGVFSG